MDAAREKIFELIDRKLLQQFLHVPGAPAGLPLRAEQCDFFVSTVQPRLAKQGYVVDYLPNDQCPIHLLPYVTAATTTHIMVVGMGKPSSPPPTLTPATTVTAAVVIPPVSFFDEENFFQ